MKKVILFTLLLTSCATNRFLYVNEKGVALYQADCGGWHNLNMGDCLIKASEQCPTGFDILFANESINGVYTGSQMMGDINTTSNYWGQSNSNASVYANKSGNNIYANAFGNSTYNGYGNSNTAVNLGAWGGMSNSYSRYIIYSCKEETPKASKK